MTDDVWQLAAAVIPIVSNLMIVVKFYTLFVCVCACGCSYPISISTFIFRRTSLFVVPFLLFLSHKKCIEHTICAKPNVKNASINSAQSAQIKSKSGNNSVQCDTGYSGRKCANSASVSGQRTHLRSRNCSFHRCHSD